jgi:hypothetical protein
MKSLLLQPIVLLLATNVHSQLISFENQLYEPHWVKAEVIQLNGGNVLRVERDLAALAFDSNRLAATVDEPTYLKLIPSNFENGSIEVKMLSQLQNPSPFRGAQGFIGVAFRISGNDSAYESIYLRPKVGRSDNQLSRNHAIQYYSYPHYKFDRLRKEAAGMYETAAPINLNEWITMRIEVNGEKAEVFIDDAKYSSMIINKMKGQNTGGAVALWVDIGTIGYFKGLKIIQN